jgi:hypothetical protein
LTISVSRLNFLVREGKPSEYTNRQTAWRCMMADNKTQDYFDDNNDGHVDTRSRNFECENKDPRLGCDMGIDVAG